jgi:hypothetical protein
MAVMVAEFSVLPAQLSTVLSTEIALERVAMVGCLPVVGDMVQVSIVTQQESLTAL